MAKPIVAIVGRPNVGKSTLFNRLIGAKKAIVHDAPGITRDRHYGESDWNGKEFILIDTGGYVPDSDDVFERAIREQVKISIEEAGLVLFLVDGQAGVLPMDDEIARLLRRSARKVILVVNKTDALKHIPNATQFYELGLGEPLPISAANGYKTGDLLDEVVADFTAQAEQADEGIMQLAIIGKPNVGKSSVTNALLGKERSIVTDIPGTTRDSIDSTMKYNGRDITLIDTAGLRRKSKVRENIEFYSTLRTLKSIERCDVALCLIDAAEGLNHQDISVISEAIDHKKGVVIAVNKWDLIEDKETNTIKHLVEEIHAQIKMYDFAPIIFISAVTKQRLRKALDLCLQVYEERRKRIPTSQLNEAMLEIVRATPPPATATGREVKLYYATQVREAPPVIVFFTNEPRYIPESYRRFVERQVRKQFGFEGVPLTVQFRQKSPNKMQDS
jgi:GTPase